MLDNLNDMLVFAEVVRSGSLTRAGAALSMPKATVSRRLTALEHQLGARLLNKNTRRLELTEIGAAYYERCLPILEQVEEARDFAGQLSARPRGRLRVSAPADMAESWLVQPFTTFCVAYPEITLDLDLTSRRVELIAEHVDVAIRSGVLEDSALVSRLLGELTQALYASPTYLIKAGTPSSPDQLAQHRFVLLQGSRKLRNTETLWCGKQSVEITMSGTVQVNGMAMMREFALAGLGIAPLPDSVAQPYLAERRLVRVLPDWAPQGHRIQLVTPSRQFMPRKIQVFIEHMLAAAPSFTTPMTPPARHRPAPGGSKD